MSKTTAALLAFAILVVTAVLLIARPARAEDETERGWTVYQGNARTVFRFKDRWTAQPNPNGITLRQETTGLEVTFYGTFRVDNRTRDLR